jgi:flagellar biosynthesis protein FlhF
LVWCANGPRVPQNLSAADAGKLVNMAVRMTKVFEVRRNGTPASIPAPEQQESVPAEVASAMQSQRGRALNVRV